MKNYLKETSLAFFSLSLLFAPSSLFAQFIVEEKSETPSKFAQQGLDTLNTTIGAINVFLGLLLLVSLIGLIVAGVRFMIAGGSESMLDSARKISLASIMGAIFSLVGYLLVNTIKYFIL